MLHVFAKAGVLKNSVRYRKTWRSYNENWPHTYVREKTRTVVSQECHCSFLL